MADNPHIHAELSRDLSLFHITEKRSDMLIMGYGHKTKSHGFRLGRTLDPVVERSACDIVIFKEPKNRLYKRILVPVAGGAGRTAHSLWRWRAFSLRRRVAA